MRKEDFKFCVDCIFYTASANESKCARAASYDLITGSKVYSDCISQRYGSSSDESLCGPEAKWFQPEEEPNAPATH